MHDQIVYSISELSNSNIVGSNGGYQLNIERIDATHKTPLDRLLSMTSPTSTFINANTSTNLSNPAGPSSSSSYSNGINNSGSSGSFFNLSSPLPRLIQRV